MPTENAEWANIEDSLQEIHARMQSASTEQDFQAVGLLCRELLITTAQLVYNSLKHGKVDNVVPSNTDSKRMLEAYFTVEMQGATKETARKYARAVVELTNDLQHRRNATIRDAAICVEATTSLVALVQITSGYPTVSTQRRLSASFSFERLLTSQEEHLYSLNIDITNSTRYTVGALKLTVWFPMLDRFSRRGRITNEGFTQTHRMVEIAIGNSDKTKVIKDDQFYQIEFRNTEPFLPHEVIHLRDFLQLQYRFTHDIYYCLKDIPLVHWEIIGDGLGLFSGEVPWDKLNFF